MPFLFAVWMAKMTPCSSMRSDIRSSLLLKTGSDREECELWPGSYWLKFKGLFVHAILFRSEVMGSRYCAIWIARSTLLWYCPTIEWLCPIFAIICLSSFPSFILIVNNAMEVVAAVRGAVRIRKHDGKSKVSVEAGRKKTLLIMKCLSFFLGLI